MMKAMDVSTLPIVLGRERALSLMSISYIFNFIWIIAWIIVGHMTWFALLAFLAAPLAFKTIRTLSTNTDEFQLDRLWVVSLG